MNDAGPNYCGNQTMCVLVNPSQIASCPDNYDKGRAVSLYFCGLVDWENGEVVPMDEEFVEKCSAEYSEKFKADLDLFTNMELEDIDPKFIGVDKILIRTLVNI